MRFRVYGLIVLILVTVTACGPSKPATILVPMSIDAPLTKATAVSHLPRVKVKEILIPKLSGQINKGDQLFWLVVQLPVPCVQCGGAHAAYYVLDADLKDLVMAVAKEQYVVDPKADQSVKLEAVFQIYKTINRSLWCEYWTVRARVQVTETFMKNGKNGPRNQSSGEREEEFCMSAGLRLTIFPSGESISSIIKESFIEALQKLRHSGNLKPSAGS